MSYGSETRVVMQAILKSGFTLTDLPERAFSIVCKHRNLRKPEDYDKLHADCARVSRCRKVSHVLVVRIHETVENVYRAGVMER